MRIINVNSKVNTFCIGHQGENNAVQIRFDYDVLFRQTYGDGVCELLIQRPGEADPYPVPLELDGNYAVWTVSNTDTDKAGQTGKAVLHYYVGETLAKTCVWMFSVMASLGAPSAEPPEKFTAWLEQVVSVGAEAKEAAIAAEAAAKDAETFAANAAKFGDYEWVPVGWHEQYDGVVIGESTQNFNGSAGYNWFDRGGENSAFLNVGDSVVVHWDGVSYECTVKNSDPDGRGVLYIGNYGAQSFAQDIPDTGEPFIFSLNNYNPYFNRIFTVELAYSADAGTHTFSVYAVEQTNYLPDKFLHPDIPRNGDTELILSSPNGTQFRITVDNAGALTATEVTT